MILKNKKQILILGGAGYIGSYVNKLLSIHGYETIILDNLETGDIRTVKNGLFYEGDLGNADLLKLIFSRHKIDAVMHFAASIDIGESVVNPLKYYNNNLIKTCTLLESMIEHDVKFFIFSSSAAIFGMPNENKICENHMKFPINPYGRSKKMIEDILEDYHKAYNLNYCNLRYFNASGGDPDCHIKFHQKKPYNLIPRAIINLKKDLPMTIFGTDYPTPDGSCIRDYIHIHDLGTAHIYALNELLENGGGANAYNLGNENGFSVREILSTIEEIIDKKFNLIEGPRRNGDPPRLIADASKAKKVLKWNPIYTNLKEIILHSVNCIS